MNNKRTVVLYLDKELVEKTLELGFNLSKTFENHLKQLLMQFSSANSVNNNGIRNVWCGRRDSPLQTGMSKPQNLDKQALFGTMQI